MPDHDPHSTGYVWLAQWAGGLFATITTALGSYFLFRRGKVKADVSDRQTEATREQHALDIAVAQSKTSYDYLREYADNLERRIEKLVADREECEKDVDAMRDERNREQQLKIEALNLLAVERYHNARLERQIIDMGGEPTNGHG